MSEYHDNPLMVMLLKASLAFIVLVVLGVIFGDPSPPKPEPYEWDTYEQRAKKEEAELQKWMESEGIGTVEKKTLEAAPSTSSDLENADTDSNTFREYMEELDNRGILPGSPEAVEIWDTYYK